jgi:hypothetical protein
VIGFLTTLWMKDSAEMGKSLKCLHCTVWNESCTDDGQIDLTRFFHSKTPQGASQEAPLPFTESRCDGSRDSRVSMIEFSAPLSMGEGLLIAKSRRAGTRFPSYT